MLNYADGATLKTPLIYLCYIKFHHNELLTRVKQLLRWTERNFATSGVTVSAMDKFHRNALHYLCETYEGPDLIAIAKILITSGIDVNAEDIFGRNALHYLCVSLSYGAEPKLKEENVKKFIGIFWFKIDFTAKDKMGRNLLHFLGQYSKTGIEFHYIVKFLRKENYLKVMMEQKDSFGRNPLHYLSKYYKGSNLKQLIQSLIPYCDVKDTDEDGKNALHYLCSENYNHSDLKDIIELLINEKIDVKAKGDNGRNALHDICISNYKEGDFIEIIRLLVNAGIDVDEENDFGETALEDLLCESEKTWEILEPIVNLLMTSSRKSNHLLTEAEKKEKLESYRTQIQTRNAGNLIIFEKEPQILGSGINNVYRGTFDGKTVAIKKVQIARLRSIEGKREERAMKKLNHENIVKLFYVEDQGEFRYEKFFST